MSGDAPLLGLKEADGGRYVHAFGDRPNRKSHVEPRGLAYTESDRTALGRGEARLLHGHDVGAGTQTGNPVKTFRRRQRVAYDAGFYVLECDFGVGNGAARGIGDGAL